MHFLLEYISRHRITVALFLAIAGIGLIGGGLFFILNYEKEIAEGYEHLEEEENLADQYLAYLLAQKEAQMKSSEEAPSKEGSDHTSSNAPEETISNSTSTKETSGSTSEESEPQEPQIPEGPTEEPWEDDQWMFSPDYAQGVIECVLEVPSAKIRRGVYTGAIENDLNYWMVVAARDEYVLGQTHYCIYGHNSTKQDLSFNNLQKNCQLGDTFTLTNEDGIYEYTITNLFSVSRSNATRKYVDNFKLSSDLCYIITCGRNEHRYKDFIVEGTLTKFTPLEELLAP